MKNDKITFTDNVTNIEICPECKGTGMYGEYVGYFNAFLDFDCPNCHGKGFVKKPFKEE